MTPDDMQVDDLHIFPFCRQSYEAGLRDGIGGRGAWNAALEEAIKIINEVEARPVGVGRSVEAIRTEIRDRMAKNDPDQAA